VFKLQRRNIKTLDFGGTMETVVERSDYPRQRIHSLFQKDKICLLGYGTQGRGQALNIRDNGLPIVVGLNEGGKSWNLALKDGWVAGKTLFPVKEAASRANVIFYLLSDAGQKVFWPTLKPLLKPGHTLVFAHGFSVVYKDQTGVVPPADIDVVMVAPKGSGTTVRRLFLEGRGINSSVGVFQDASGKAQERAYALAVAVGSGYMYETTFQKEVYSDLTGERGVLMGGINGMFMAQYEVLREKGHSPSEAFNETVEEATQSLYPLIGENGMEYMYANCSTTAQRGALDWWPKFRDATKPVFRSLYESVEKGQETKRTLDENNRPDSNARREKELEAIKNLEIWRAGVTVRSLRPERQKKE